MKHVTFSIAIFFAFFSFGQSISWVKSSTVTSPPVASFSVSADTLCLRDTVFFTDLSTNNPTSWIWSVPGVTTANVFANNCYFVFNTAGTFTANLFCSNNSGSSTATMTLFVSAHPSITVVSNPSVVPYGNGVTLTASGASTYTWSNSATGSTTIVYPFYNVTYSVSGANQFGCVTTATVKARGEVVHSIVDNSLVTPVVTVFPNPNEGRFTLKISEIVNLDFTVCNTNGVVIQSGRSEGPNEISIDLRNEPKGTYFFHIMFEGKVKTFKLLKQ